ncbi:lipid II flippase MurJ [Actinacidiphila bryophytorum]|uniref:Peptidoglycan lipid II flippase n=1 Tax=Actinacidiphila bryophytorum TaxID=1436133 RepID=A0A9W4H4R4_9ACTN|nr:lipid II flippase MurJ [Actinacidiphila bryophytorum]MBM9435707.1 virulence factor MviN [Actinacidiphila bryophytorum]MBN6547262.1 virulence factor MviN [Actinacidiphila bryophytorum]CAG7650616.1 Putative peptidoglycan lipid II flippase [Actinacidiphila bryophytorum]
MTDVVRVRARERARHAAPRSFVARAAALTAGLSVAGSGLGLLRDQVIARLFGAGAGSDAFLVAWTVPELAATVLIEDAMALLLVPAFSAALAKGGAAALVRGTLPRLAALLAAATAALYAAAPLVVHLLAPGLADPRLAVSCTRLTAATVLTFGLAGYLSAALRAHRRFLPPAAVYVAYNAAIITTLLALHARWGVRAAAAGVAVGGAAMVLVQLPSFVRALRLPPLPAPASAPASGGRTAAVGMAVVAPVVLFALTRQAQVLVERFFAADLPAGAISHLNYAQKVAQLPMVLSLMVCTVTFPVVARALAEGDREGARQRVERDLTLACVVVLLGTAYVLACAPQIVQALFQRGAFDAADTAATASVMRVYALGLLGQSLVGALIRPYFSAGRPTWYPVAAMAAGLGVTAAADAAAVTAWGAYGIAAGNAAGISLTAALLLRGLPARAVPVRIPALTAAVSRYALAAAAATGAGWCTTRLLPAGAPAAAVAAACCLTVPLAFAAAAAAAGAPVRSLHHAV